MQKYDAIENGIANNDVEALREAIGTIIYTNRDFSNGEFFQVVAYVEESGIKLKDPGLVGSPTISSQKSEFTDEDFARAIFELKKNFCEERIQDVKTISEKLYGKKQKVKIPNEKGTTERGGGGKPPKEPRHQQRKNPMVIGLVALVGIIIVVCLLVMK